MQYLNQNFCSTDHTFCKAKLCSHRSKYGVLTLKPSPQMWEENGGNDSFTFSMVSKVLVSLFKYVVIRLKLLNELPDNYSNNDTFFALIKYNFSHIITSKGTSNFKWHYIFAMYIVTCTNCTSRGSDLWLFIYPSQYQGGYLLKSTSISFTLNPRNLYY